MISDVRGVASIKKRRAGGVHILVINSGSSSIKFSVFAAGGHTPSASGSTPKELFTGEISGIGSPHPHFSFSGEGVKTSPPDDADPGPDDQTDPLFLIEKAVAGPSVPPIDAVGYRVVHPGPHLDRHQRITDEVLAALERAVDFAPLHDPQALHIIREMMQRLPQASHYACFDTVFHQTMPAAASTYPIPVTLREQGVRRYGFHGLSYESVVDELRAAADRGELVFPARMVIAHLGSGCSVTALLGGQSLDTSMGLTPTGGVVMGTRPGDLDPGLVLYLLRQAEGDRKAALDSVEAMLNHKAGMVALSGQPNDMQAVRKAEATSDEARLAIAVFTRSVRKTMGAYAWLLGGLDAIVFTGGIGEHDVLSRQEILQELDSFGIALDAQANQATGDAPRRISAANSQVAVWVVPAQEDRMIAVHVCALENNVAQ